MMYESAAMEMIRKQVYIEQRQEVMLKRNARLRGVTEAEIIRDALDRAEIAGNKSRGAASDPAAGRKAVGFMRSLALKPRRASAGRTWTRESLYEDRMERWTKS